MAGKNPLENDIRRVIINPVGLEGNSAELYRTLMDHALREIATAPGRSTFIYMLVERSCYMYAIMKAMEETGVNILDMSRYNTFFTLFTRISGNVLTEVKKIFNDDTNLQYLFVSRIMESLAGAVSDSMASEDAELLLKNVRENLYALIEPPS
jgi:hypothetical protein